ncbi:adipolin-like [Homarus americanus]|uniref:adipolin-like n=1 Tax=Homarus americanus TaxID=6706 RepID=UPI001C469A37|nr:adipolin-like [Homarus americanus]
MRLSRFCSNAVGASLLLVVVGVRTSLGIRSMVRGGQARDVALGSNTLQGLQSMWYKDSQEEDRVLVLDPRDTWKAFIRNSERQKKARKRKNRKKGRRNQIPVPREGPEGPPGRRGPQGPAGPPGGTLTTQEMEEYIKDFLRDYLQNNNNTLNVTGLLEEEEEEAQQKSNKMRVKAAFTATLPQPLVLKPSGLAIVDTFTITFSPGVFERRMVVEHGGFTVTKKGIYQVAASLVLHPRGRPNTPLRALNDVSVYLCISTCSKDRRRLEWSGSLGDGSVTAVLSGHVLLLRGDTLLVAVDNPTKRPLQVGTGSSFSAALIGV